MEILNFEFSASEAAAKSALVGCVGSGDLEILMEPSSSNVTTIQVITSVDGSEQRWKNLFERIFQSRSNVQSTSKFMTLVQHRALSV